MEYTGHPDQHYGHVTYSQHGEDLFIVNMCKLIGLDKPSYLDLGAHHPLNISNTALLYSRGSRGVNVDANPALIEEFNKQRPEDTNVCIGVAPMEGEMEFKMYDETSGLNSFANAVDFDPTAVKKLPVTTVDALVEKYCNGQYPDILFTDLEGLDAVVMATAKITHKNRPKIICTEISRDSQITMGHILFRKNYDYVARLGANLIYVSNELSRFV